VRPDASAFLAVLLASTGLTRADAAAMLQVDVRTVRRWLAGTRPTPKVAVERLRAWAYCLDETAQRIIKAMGVPAEHLGYQPDDNSSDQRGKGRGRRSVSPAQPWVKFPSQQGASGPPKRLPQPRPKALGSILT